MFEEEVPVYAIIVLEGELWVNVLFVFYMHLVFFVKNIILHANSYKDPSHYKV